MSDVHGNPRGGPTDPAGSAAGAGSAGEPSQRAGSGAGEGSSLPTSQPPRRDLAHRADPTMASDALPDAGAPLTETSRAPIPDPGLPPHLHRQSDIDPKAAKRAERQVAGLFGLSALATLGFLVAYFAIPEDAVFLRMGAHNLALGVTLGIALFCIGAAAIHWAKKLMPDVEIVEERKPLRSTDEDRALMVTTFQEGAAASGFARRRLIQGSLVGAMGLLGLPALVLLRDLGPNPEGAPSRTLWDETSDDLPIRVVNDITFEPIRPEDIPVGGLVNAMPENFEGSDRVHGVPHEGPERLNARAHSPVIVVRMSPEEIRSQQGDNWDYEGILCFSKICTHIGCPINLYERRTHHLLCPCHQSTFDLSDAAKVIFGPAGHHLPQLPLAVDEEGYLVAAKPFQEAVGPPFWERGSADT